MKRFFLVMLLLSTFALFSDACPSYTLIDKTPEELEQEFNEIINTLDSDFVKLKDTFGQQSYVEFKKLISDWMTLYTKYECWLDVTEKKLAKTPMPQSRKWFSELKDISVKLGQAVTKFNEKDYRNSRKLFLESHTEFIITFKSDKYRMEKEFYEFFTEYIKNRKWNELLSYYRDNSKNIDTILNYAEKNSDKKDIREYYSKMSLFYKKLSQSIDNTEKLNYTRDELLQLLNNYTYFRFEHIEKIKKMWSEEFL